LAAATEIRRRVFAHHHLAAAVAAAAAAPPHVVVMAVVLCRVSAHGQGLLLLRRRRRRLVVAATTARLLLLLFRAAIVGQREAAHAERFRYGHAAAGTRTARVIAIRTRVPAGRHTPVVAVIAGLLDVVLRRQHVRIASRVSGRGAVGSRVPGPPALVPRRVGPHERVGRHLALHAHLLPVLRLGTALARRRVLRIEQPVHRRLLGGRRGLLLGRGGVELEHAHGLSVLGLFRRPVFAHRVVSRLGAHELDQRAHVAAHLRMLVDEMTDVRRYGVAGTEHADKSDLAAAAEQLGHRLDGHRLLLGQVDGHHGPGRRRLVVRGQRLLAPELRAGFVYFQLLRPGDGVRDRPPILGQVFHPLERRDELQGHVSLLVAADVLEQERVLDDVRVREVKLHLVEYALGGLLVGRHERRGLVAGLVLAAALVRRIGRIGVVDAGGGRDGRDRVMSATVVGAGPARVVGRRHASGLAQRAWVKRRRVVRQRYVAVHGRHAGALQVERFADDRQRGRLTAVDVGQRSYDLFGEFSVDGRRCGRGLCGGHTLFLFDGDLLLDLFRFD